MFQTLRYANRGRRVLRIAGIAGVAIAALAALPGAAAGSVKGAFASDYNASSLRGFTFGAGQTLSAAGSAPSGTGAWFEAVTPNAKYLYLANYSDGTIGQYRITSAGALSPLTPATVTVAGTPVQVAISPDGRNLYATSRSGTLSILDIRSDGTLSNLRTVTTGLSDVVSVAVSPNGTSVYAADATSAKIFEYDRAANGGLTRKSGPSITAPSGNYPDLALSPNGRYLYESTYEGTINEFRVGSGGELSALPVPSTVAGTSNYAMIVSPNGRNAYSDSCNSAGISQYAVSSNGELTPLAPASVGTAACGLPWMSASGASLYMPHFDPTISQYNVSASGALTPKAPATVTYTGANTLWGFVIPPDQGPVAKFSVKAGRAGKASKFNASKSHDSDGKVVRYVWKFGRKTKTTKKPKISYKFKKAGKYTVGLTVIDDSGCSTTQVFTGQTAYCNGTKAAKHTRKVKIKKRAHH